MNPHRPAHIVHLTTDSAIGGTERMILAVATGLPVHLFRSSVVTLKGGGVLEAACTDRSIPYYSLAMRSKIDIGAPMRLMRLLKSLEPDILHTYLFHANVLGRTVGRMAGVPVIVSGQRNVDLWRRGYHHMIDRYTSRWCDIIISNSHAGEKFLIERTGINPSKIDVVHNGISLPADDLSLAERSAPYTLVTVASLTPQKGHEYLIAAFSRLRQRGFSGKLIIVGTGKRHDELVACVRNAGCVDAVDFVGFTNDVSVYLKQADIFILPSLWEGIPVALMEAMSYGIPCIASQVGGVPELIDHRINGILVEPGNVEQLTETITDITNDAQMRQKIGAAARRKIASRFSLDAMIESLTAIYSRLLKQGAD